MSFANDVSPSTPAEKLSQLTSNIHTLLQELNEPGSPHSSSSNTVQRDRLSEALRNFQQQQLAIQDIIGSINQTDASASPR
jgi:hypothetical protein